MKINVNSKNPNFGRAFTTSEKQAYKRLIKDTKSALGIKDTTAVIFDFNMPSKAGKNTAIGTTFSDSLKQFIPFLKDMTGITSVQLQPQGKITKGNTSPYSGTTFAIGRHIIDLSKLTTPQYGCLLQERTIKFLDDKYSGDKQEREFRTNYPYVIGTDKKNGIQNNTLRIAFDNFKNKTAHNKMEIFPLHLEYVNFKNKNKEWLEKEAMYSVLSQEYQTGDIKKWSEQDKKLYSKETPKNVRLARISELKKKYYNEFEFEYFTQFIADKQQKEAHKFLNFHNIKLYGDCLIGFSKSEMWSNIDCFKENLFYGGPDPDCTETNGIQAWGLPALDYRLLGECDETLDCSKLKDSGKLLFDKYKLFFERYDGIRVDAAWQFITPFLYENKNGQIEQAQIPETNMTIFNIMKAAEKEANSGKKNIMLELVGLNSDSARKKTLNIYPHLYTTAFSEYDENPKKFIEKGYERDYFYTGVSNHDNESLVNMAKDGNKRQLHTKGFQDNYGFDTQNARFSAKEYQNQSQALKTNEDFRTSKFGEIYTGANQFFTLPDMFGMTQRINISGKVNPDNWTVRVPNDYERFYFSQLSDGYGLNLPKALAIAMKMNNIQNEELMKKCSQAAEILREKGPLTEQEANSAQKNGKIKNIFEYE